MRIGHGYDVHKLVENRDLLNEISEYLLAKETISPLLGEGASPQLRQLIVDVVKEDPSYRNQDHQYHQLQLKKHQYLQLVQGFQDM